MKKYLFFILIGAIVSVLFVSAIKIAAAQVIYDPPPCQLQTQAGDILVDFGGQYLLTDTVAYPPIVRSANIPAGHYDIYLQSFDGYDIRVDVTQPHEQYFVAFNNSLGGEVARTNPTPDLQDYVETAAWSGLINSNLYLDNNAVQAVAQHAADGSTGANSVRAICMVMRFLEPPAPSPVYSLSIQKTVRNLTAGSSSYTESVSANNNDNISFQIQIQNTGNTTLNNVYVRDDLPDYLSYTSGTAKLDGVSISDSLMSGGVNIGSLTASSSKSVTFEAKVNGASSQTLTNYAYVHAYNVGEVNDTAVVNVESSADLNITKTVRNLTKGTDLSSSVNADPGDHILFSISVSIPGDAAAATNVLVWDSLPSGLDYINGSTKIDNISTADGLISGGISLGTINPNQIKNITFETTVSSAGSQTLTNYAYASADNITQRQASAQVAVGAAPLYDPDLSKQVANLTWSNGSGTDNKARVGDVLQYTISYTNNANSTLDNIQILDTLPPYVSYNGNVSHNGVYYSGDIIAWNIGSLSPGQSISVTYQAIVESVPSDNYVITNTAILRATGLSDIISNETRTAVVFKYDGIIRAVTGGNDLFRNLALAVLITFWVIFIAYLIIKHPDFLQGAGLMVKTIGMRILGK